MQKNKLETFSCNICARAQGTVLLDCYCLFCLDCFQPTDIEKEYSERAKHYKKGKTAEKCQRCKRNTEYKIYYLDKKSDSDHCRMLFGGLTGGFMSFFRVLEFQTLQRNREIQNLSTTLQDVYKKVGTLLNENSHLSKYFDEKDIKNIKGLDNSTEQITQNNAGDKSKTMTETRSKNDNIPPPSAHKDTTGRNTEFVKTPHNNRMNKHKEHDRVQNSNMSTFQDSSKPRERSAKQVIDNGGNLSNNQRGHVKTGIDKGKRKETEHKMFEEQQQQQILHKKSLMKNQGNEYQTPVGPQLKKAKITPNQNLEANPKEELKKLFGFELKEIKKTSPRPSTEKTDKGTENVKAPNLKVQQQLQQLKPQRQVQHQNEKNNYWGRGYHLNYPSYN